MKFLKPLFCLFFRIGSCTLLVSGLLPRVCLHFPTVILKRCNIHGLVSSFIYETAQATGNRGRCHRETPYQIIPRSNSVDLVQSSRNCQQMQIENAGKSEPHHLRFIAVPTSFRLQIPKPLPFTTN